jgi:septal ring factor EnvC (AmiA/AmiB activator)
MGMTRLTLLLILTTCSVFAQKRVDVVENPATIDGVERNCLTVSITGGNVEDVKKAWKDQLKSLKGKVDDKTIIFCDDCKAKSMGDGTFDVYSTVEPTRDTSAKLIVAFDLGGTILNSVEHAEKYAAAAKIVRTFGVEQSKAVVQAEIDAKEKELKALEKDLNGLEKDKEKAEKDIADNEGKIGANKELISGSIADQKAKQSEIHRLEQGQIEHPSDDVAKLIKGYEKELEGMKKDKTGLEKDIEKLTEKIKESKAAIEQNLKDQGTKKAEIAAMKKVIAALGAKLDAII